MRTDDDIRGFIDDIAYIMAGLYENGWGHQKVYDDESLPSSFCGRPWQKLGAWDVTCAQVMPLVMTQVISSRSFVSYISMSVLFSSVVYYDYSCQLKENNSLLYYYCCCYYYYTGDDTCDDTDDDTCDDTIDDAGDDTDDDAGDDTSDDTSDDTGDDTSDHTIDDTGVDMQVSCHQRRLLTIKHLISLIYLYPRFVSFLKFIVIFGLL